MNSLFDFLITVLCNFFCVYIHIVLHCNFVYIMCCIMCTCSISVVVVCVLYVAASIMLQVYVINNQAINHHSNKIDIRIYILSSTHQNAIEM